MSIEELITKLQVYPGHFEVRAAVVFQEEDDEVAEIVNVTNRVENKIVELVLDGRPTS